MKTFSLTISVLLLAFSPALADDVYVTFAKSLTAKQYDNSLPSIPIKQWLISVLPRDINVVWAENITDCGEQTGDPKIDKGRDMPMCAEIELKQNDKLIGYLLLFVGTEKRGQLKDNAGLYYGYIKKEAKTIYLRKLGEIIK